MACACEIVLDADDSTWAQSQAQQAMQEVLRIERKYSRYRPDSVVARINAAAGQAAQVCDEETLSLLGFAQEMHAQSDGLFDITSGVLRHAWRFDQAQLPEPALLERLLPLVGWATVERQGDSVRLPKAGMEIDFGGFGKEYAADCAAALLRQAGVRHGYVNLGGDICLMGPRADGSAWVMGIQHPRQSHQILATQAMQHGALATSGDYERFMLVQGQRYCHILHPRSGWPVTHWQSISVLAPVAVMAGALSTVAMLKEDQALAFLQASGCAYLAVDAQGQIFKN